jgi:hypothetical protein
LTTATASFSFVDASGASFSLSSSADLASGVVTVYSQALLASSSIWDSFTYTGLPSSGATITASLSLPGTLTGSSDGTAILEEGSLTDFNNGTQLENFLFFDNTDKPSSFPLSFDVTNGVPVIVFAELRGAGDSLGGIADFGDPPTLTLTLPRGANVDTASAFNNFVPATVPEPSTWAMLLVGFAGLGYASYRTSRRVTG